MENNPGSELTAMLWHHGESDVGSMSYENDLDNFIDAEIMETWDLNADDVPFELIMWDDLQNKKPSFLGTRYII